VASSGEREFLSPFAAVSRSLLLERVRATSEDCCFSSLERGRNRTDSSRASNLFLATLGRHRSRGRPEKPHRIVPPFEEFSHLFRTANLRLRLVSREDVFACFKFWREEEPRRLRRWGVARPWPESRGGRSRRKTQLTSFPRSECSFGFVFYCSPLL
jgi:hypothetical protein